MENFIQIGITVFSFLSAYIISLLASRRNIKWHSIIGYLLLLSIIVGSINIYYNEYSISERIKKTEDYQFKEKLVGTWIENYKIDTVQFYSIAKINYNLDKNSLVFKGTSYDENGNKKGSWNSTILFVDSERESILYFHDGQMGTDNLSKYGYGRINYQTKNKENNKFSYGDGFFADEFTNYEPINFKTDRLTEDFCSKLIDKEQAIDTKSKQELVKAYHEYLGE